MALDLARVLNAELRELVRAGATHLQIDEPYYSGFPEDLPGHPRGQRDGRSVDAHISLHICYGNRYGKPSWEGSYRYLFPTILEARVNAVSLEFARRGDEDLQLFKEFDAPFSLGLGVVDVKSQESNPRASWPIAFAGRSSRSRRSAWSSTPTAGACICRVRSRSTS